MAFMLQFATNGCMNTAPYGRRKSSSDPNAPETTICVALVRLKLAPFLPPRSRQGFVFQTPAIARALEVRTTSAVITHASVRDIPR